jgi:hypothetical protein
VRRGTALASIAAVLVIAGCGSDDSGETTAPTVSIPAITSPIPATTTTAPATTSTPTGTTGKGNGNGGTGPPSHPNPNQPDSETNDVPPPAGSPQEAFEKQCEQNPQACG